jgi:hypothetical protein
MDYFQGVGESASDGESETHCYVPYIPAIRAPLSQMDFEYYWAEELVTAYHALKDQCAANGWSLFESLDFCDFCKFAYLKSSKSKPAC